MSEDTKKLYLAKFAEEFALFEERKINIDRREDPTLLIALDHFCDIHELSKIEKKLEEHKPINKEDAVEICKEYANSRRHEIYEGYFVERKKCIYCVHLGNFELFDKKPSPCKKLNAWIKIMNCSAGSDLNTFDNWHLECDDTYVPRDDCDVRAELQKLERKQLEIISEWEAAALEQIKNQN
jgi:hypothetical protein